MVTPEIPEINLTGLCNFADERSIFNPDLQRVEVSVVLIAVSKLIQFGGKGMCQQRNAQRDIFKSLWSMEHGIHSRHICKQRLRGTDIRSCFLSFNMLFPGLQGHS